MNKIAVFPGSFDPFTIGHESLVNRALNIFDVLIIAIGINSGKTNLFSTEERKKLISNHFKSNTRIRVEFYSELTVDFCNKLDAKFILRGLRTSSDFEYERAIGQFNKVLSPEIETVFLLTLPEHSFITSSIVRDIIQRGGNASAFVPEGFLVNLH
jgi:pantetheine-phosphate adenylyltransferase